MSAVFESGLRVRMETAPAPRLLPRGSLATWQAKRVCLYVQENLANELGTEALARLVNLSPSHFCRAFKRTFGMTVHRFVMHSRIERARELILTTSEPLSSIALSCGLSDQSHLTRWFHRVIGTPPAAWRRAQVERW